MEKATHAAELFPHIRIVIGMVIGLGLTRLLTGVARILQHRQQIPLDPIHLAWVASVMLTLVHFWWWQFGLYEVPAWTFEKYLFIVGYAVLLFLLSAFLFPDSMAEYASYGDFFFARRGWFFGLLAATFVFDVVDTLLKGEAHFARFGTEYAIRTPLLVAACLVAIWTPRRAYHAAFVTILLLYQVSWIARLFDTMQ
ncbi:MAG: hypothetical protein J0H34_14220 [Rhizobiales bacterium]|nr:hypothetical protein [Hyphomicrobiales bacterium]